MHGFNVYPFWLPLQSVACCHAIVQQYIIFLCYDCFTNTLCLTGAPRTLLDTCADTAVRRRRLIFSDLSADRAHANAKHVRLEHHELRSCADTAVRRSSSSDSPGQAALEPPLASKGVTRVRPRTWGDNSHSAKGPGGQSQGSQDGFKCVLVSPEGVPGVRKGVRRGPPGPPRPLELRALPRTRTRRPSQSSSIDEPSTAMHISCVISRLDSTASASAVSPCPSTKMLTMRRKPPIS